MLTKEEAKEFYIMFYESEKSFKETLERFTEKPKREIQVGDIYLDNENRTHIVMNNKFSSIEPIRTHLAYFKGDGSHCHDAYTLDLSKRYKLVEIDDE